MKRSKKIKIIVYALIAYFLVLALLCFDFAEVLVYAAEDDTSEEITIDYRWLQAGDSAGTQLTTTYNYNYWNDCYSKNVKFPKFSSSVEKSNLGYFSWWGSYSNYTGSFTSDTEIVSYVGCGITEDLVDSQGNFLTGNYGSAISSKPDYYKKAVYGGVVSKSQIVYSFYSGKRQQDSLGYYFEFSPSVNSQLSESCVYDGDNYQIVNSFTPYFSNFDFGFYAGKIKMFDSYKHAINYLKTGSTDGLLSDGKEYDGENIYLDNFEMYVHDSNEFSKYYITFTYSIPESLKTASSLNLIVNSYYQYCITGLSGVFPEDWSYYGQPDFIIDLLRYPTEYTIQLEDIDAVSQFVNDKDYQPGKNTSKRRLLGSTGVVEILSSLGEGIARIDKSSLSLDCFVVANGCYGVDYSGYVDFLTGSNSMSSYTPDSSGKYKYNDDCKNNGHYYTDVSTDAAGNTIYNYYYYGNDNSKTEISAEDSNNNTLTVSPGGGGSSSGNSVINNVTLPDHIFVTVSGNSGGGESGDQFPDVTIEDDDLSFDSLRDAVKDGFGLIDDTDTGAKGDGLVAMMSDLFGYLPKSFTALIMLGMSSVVSIAIIRMIFKR